MADFSNTPDSGNGLAWSRDTRNAGGSGEFSRIPDSRICGARGAPMAGCRTWRVWRGPRTRSWPRPRSSSATVVQPHPQIASKTHVFLKRNRRTSPKKLRGHMTARQRLPSRRASTTFDFECGPHRYTATVAYFPGTDSLAEIFLSNGRAGSDIDAAAKDSAVVASIGLQHGIAVETIRKALLRDPRGVASSPLGVALDMPVQ
jgi:hypothetical protein